MSRILALLAVIIAGLVAAPATVAVAATQELNINRPGGDFASFEMRRPVAAACEETCEGNPSCYAWTYVKPGIQGRRARCWLKSRIPAAVPDTCCISGATRLMQFPGKTKLPF